MSLQMIMPVSVARNVVADFANADHNVQTPSAYSQLYIMECLTSVSKRHAICCRIYCRPAQVKARGSKTLERRLACYASTTVSHCIFFSLDHDCIYAQTDTIVIGQLQANAVAPASFWRWDTCSTCSWRIAVLSIVRRDSVIGEYVGSL